MNGETRPGVSAGSKSVGAGVKCTAEVNCPSGAAFTSAAATSIRANTHTMRYPARRLIGIVSFLWQWPPTYHNHLSRGLLYGATLAVLAYRMLQRLSRRAPQGDAWSASEYHS